MAETLPAPLNALRIDRASSVPIYHQIAGCLTQLIDSGALTPGQLLPSETELSRVLGISPMTARQALSTMEKRGLIRRQRGVGSFVLARMFDRPLDQLVGFTQDMTERGIKATSRILRFERIAAPLEVAGFCAIEPGTEILRIKRLRLANDQAVAVADAYLPGVEFERSELEAAGSIYSVLDERGIRPVRGEEFIDAVVAQEEECRLLKIPVHTPMLRMRLLTWATHNRFVEYSVTVYRADLYQFHARVGTW